MCSWAGSFRSVLLTQKLLGLPEVIDVFQRMRVGITTTVKQSVTSDFGRDSSRVTIPAHRVRLQSSFRARPRAGRRPPDRSALGLL